MNDTLPPNKCCADIKNRYHLNERRTIMKLLIVYIRHIFTYVANLRSYVLRFAFHMLLVYKSDCLIDRSLFCLSITHPVDVFYKAFICNNFQWLMNNKWKDVWKNDETAKFWPNYSRMWFVKWRNLINEYKVKRPKVNQSVVRNCVLLMRLIWPSNLMNIDKWNCFLARWYSSAKYICLRIQ